MRKTILLATAALSAAIAPLSIAETAIAQSYGSQDLAFSMSLNWVLLASRDSVREGDTALLSYLCITQDNLMGLSKTAGAERYAVYWNFVTSEFEIEPLNAIVVHPQNQGYVARESEPSALESILPNTELDASESWFLNEGAPEPLAMACLNGGMAGALNQLEASHGITIQQQ